MNEQIDMQKIVVRGFKILSKSNDQEGDITKMAP